MSTDYNPLASSYDIAVNSLPESYINLINNTFSILNSHRVIDLGCGTGLLTVPLSEFSDHVQGLDMSEKMIEIARGKRTHSKVNWIHNSSKDFDFFPNTYDLIIGLESFHEFLDLPFVKKCHRALKNRGALAHGWVNYHWEDVFQEAIIDIFSSMNIFWGDWNYYTCPNFPNLLEKIENGFTDAQHLYVDVIESTKIDKIALYLVSIDKVANLSQQERERLKQSLNSKLRKIINNDEVVGSSRYNLRYAFKCS